MNPKKKTARLIIFIFYGINLIHTTTYANIGFDLNQTLQQFFGSGQEPSQDLPPPLSQNEFEKNFENFKIFDDEPIENSSTQKKQNFNIPEVVIPQNPNLDDLNNFKQEIFAEESSLDEFNRLLAQEEQALWTVQENRNSTRTQVMLLDQQIDFNTQKLKKYNTQIKKWRQKIEQITEAQSVLRTIIRTKEKRYQKAQQKNYFQNQALDRNQEASLFSWLFSDQSTSKILEDKKNRQKNIQRQRQQIKGLKQIKHQQNIQEKKIALLYGQLNKNQQQVAREKERLIAFTEGKSQLIKRLNSSEVEQKNNLKNYQRQKNETALYLQNLRHGLKETTEKLNNNFDQKEIPDSKSKNLEDPGLHTSTKIFDFPLKIEPIITAKFRDPDYKKRFKKEHDGADFYAPQGTSIYAPADGLVKKIKTGTYDYAYIILQHDSDLYTIYGHLSDVNVQRGDPIFKGEILGKTGGTPGTKGAGYFTTGPHLHWEVFENNQYQDPLQYLSKK